MPRAPRLTAAERRAHRRRIQHALRALLTPLDPSPDDFLHFAEACCNRGAKHEAFLALLIGFERHVFGIEPDRPRPTGPQRALPPPQTAAPRPTARRPRKKSRVETDIDHSSEQLAASMLGHRHFTPDLCLDFAAAYADKGNDRLAYFVIRHAFQAFALPAAPAPAPETPDERTRRLHALFARVTPAPQTTPSVANEPGPKPTHPGSPQR